MQESTFRQEGQVNRSRGLKSVTVNLTLRSFSIISFFSPHTISQHNSSQSTVVLYQPETDPRHGKHGARIQQQPADWAEDDR